MRGCRCDRACSGFRLGQRVPQRGWNAARTALGRDASNEHIERGEQLIAAADALAPERPPWQAEEDGDGAGGAAAANGAEAAAGQEEMDACMAALAGLGADDGVFELTLHGGQVLGVALQRDRGGLHYLLSTADAALGRKLRQRGRELERGLAQRMQQRVAVTVL